MAKRRKFREDDLAIWQKVRSTIKPLPDAARSEKRADQAIIGPNLEETRLGSPMPIAPKPKGIAIDFKKELPVQDIYGLKRSTQRDISKGRIEPTAKIDLHGQRLEAARANFQRFIVQSMTQGHRVVLVITGKGGYHRKDEFGRQVSGVIRRSLPEWLHDRELASYVSHYTPAHIKHGGDGAWYVFIRNSARRAHRR